MRKTILSSASLFVSIIFTIAGIRDAGKYNGVVLFDRWDCCCLSSAVYLMYIPEKLKETVRPYTGKSILLDATKVYQPMNPGDGRLDEFTFVGLSKLDTGYKGIDQLELKVSLVFEERGRSALKLAMHNHWSKSLVIDPGELALTVLSRKSDMDPNWVSWPEPSDGSSYALVTRHEFFCMDPKSGRHEVSDGERRAVFQVRGQTQQMKRFELLPDETKEFIVDFTLTKGEYDIFVGYGDGVHASLSMASNMIAVDVAPDGKVTFPKITGR